MSDGDLHRSFGEACCFGQDFIAGSNGGFASAVRLPVEVQINQIGGRGAAMAHEVPHERVDEIRIEFHTL